MNLNDILSLVGSLVCSKKPETTLAGDSLSREFVIGAESRGVRGECLIAL